MPKENNVSEPSVKSVKIGETEFTLPFLDLLPRLTPQEHEALKADIAQNGVLVPICIDENNAIIDGAHRAMLAEEVGCRHVEFIIHPGLTYEQKHQLSLNMNLTRRHLSPDQLRKLEVMLAQQGMSLRVIGQALKVSHEKVRRDLRRATVSDVTVTLPDKIRGKDGKVRPARIFAKTPREAQEAAAACRSMAGAALPHKLIDSKRVARLAREHCARERAQHPASDYLSGDGKVTLLYGDFRERGKEIPDTTVDLVFTDPPYAPSEIDLWSDLGKLAQRVLKPGGLLLAYSGQSCFDQVLRRLSEHLTYVWMCAARHTGGTSPRWDVRVLNAWKPLVLFAKNPLKVWWSLFCDLTGGGKEKELHDWQQPVSETVHFLKALCPPNGLVLDPMAGSGTTAAAAASLGLNCISIEIENKAFASAQQRLTADRAA